MLKRDDILSYVVCMIMFYPTLHGVTEVYNLRISTITSEQIELTEPSGVKNPPEIFSTKLVTRIRKDKLTNQLLVANMNNFIYSYGDFYARADGGFGYVREKSIVATTKHTQLDDLLLSVGYRHMINQRVHLTYTVLGGIPTHKDNGLQFFQFGTGHYSIGGQIDALFKYETHHWITALRCVHFFKARATVPLATACISVDFSLGNLTDMILAFYKKIHKDHSLEIGYNPTFLTNVSTSPPLNPVLPSYGIRNSWYSIYRYNFVKDAYPMTIGLSASYGLDIAPKIDRASKRNMSFWISYTIKF